MKEKIHKLPKADVHNHLHLGGTSKMLKEKYFNASIGIPKYYDGLDGMINFIENKLNKIMCTSSDVIFFMEMAIESCIDDNVEYLEAGVDIGLVRFFDDSIERLTDVVYDLKKKYASRIDFRPDIGINKDSEIDKAYSNSMICIASGIYNGIDLYGKEINRKLDGFVELYDSARANNLKTKVHIGEFSNHESIEETIKLLDPD